MNNRALPLLSILVGAAFFFSAIFFAGTALRFVRVDLTAEKLYTLSGGTRSILSKIEEPITLRLFYTAELAPQVGLDNFGRRVIELLEEFENAADGKLVLQIIEPEQYSEAEELATSLGVRGQMASAQGDLFFFGIAATNSVDDLETLPSLNPGQESFLEYELAKLISKLSSGELPTVAVLSSLPLDGGAGANPFGPPQPAWRIVEQLREIFEVEFLEPELTDAIDEDTDVLLIVHPKALSDATRYAIDQFALGGGRVCALVDAHCYFDQPPPAQQQRGPVDNSSHLDDLLGAWGLQLVPTAVIGDLALAQRIPIRNQPFPFPLWMEINAQLDEELFNDEDPVTATMKLVTLLTPGELRAAEEASTTFTPLLQTTPGGRALDALQLQYAQDLLSLAPTILDDFLLHAEGSIEFTGVPEDGATVTLSDGLRAPVTFEFSTDGTTAEGNQAVDVTGADSASAAAMALYVQVLMLSVQVTETTGIDLEANTSGAKLELVNREAGPHGVTAIRRTGELAAEVSGMEIRGLRKVLAARVSGPIATAFPGGAPEGWLGAGEPLTSSSEDFNGIVIADVDFLNEQFWASRSTMRMNDNPSVLINALENLCGSNDLLSLRSRGVERRPFQKKEELERKAAERFQTKADELLKKQQRLRQEDQELMQGADEQGVVRITQQQLEEHRDKEQEIFETRKELGRVEGERREETRSLGNRLFLANILIAPGLVILLGLLYGLLMISRRKSK